MYPLPRKKTPVDTPGLCIDTDTQISSDLSLINTMEIVSMLLSNRRGLGVYPNAPIKVEGTRSATLLLWVDLKHGLV
jgi:hypothetical protein